MASIMYMIGVLLLIFIIKVESSYYVYTYDDGIGGDDDEHCCLVRLGENFCLAKPLTRSLVQVNEGCQRLGANENNKNYWKKIVRRLNVETSQKIGDKILIQLEKPLEKNILNNDLLCLSSTTNNIDLEKCHVELTVDEKKNQKQKSKNETTEEEEEEEEDEDESNDENKIRQVEITEPIQIRKGHGVSVRQTYELNLTNFRATTHQQRECWSWYRKHTKNILIHPTKFQKSCISLNNQEEKCLKQLFYKKTNADQQQLYSINSIQIGSKLYCENNNKQSKLLGYHRHSEICFTTHYQIYIDHKFTDFLSLSDIKKNKDVLQFISNNTKLTNEFEADCNDKKSLVDIKNSLEEEEAEPSTFKDDL